MKKLLYTIAAIAAVTMAASCAREMEVAQVNGEQVTATFSVDLPGVATKAISDGKTAAELNFAVYDEAGNYLQTLSETAAQVTKTSDLHWTVTVPVIKDLTYQFVFVAKKANGIYTLDKANASLSVDYSAVDANTDDYDLFYAVTTEEIGNDLKKAVNLTRPLAQVNIGASDLAAAAYSLDVANMTTGITLSGIHTGLNLLTGAVTEATSDVTFAPAARVNEETAFVTGFDRIAMAYVLVGEKQTTTATFTAVANGTADNASHTVTREVENVPIQRNYRTNIVGPIFTSTMEFNVTVEPGFVQNGDFTVVPVVVSNVSALNTALSESKEETTDLNYEVTTVEETTANTNTAVIVIPDNTKAASLTFNLSDVEVNAITIQDETPATDESNYAKDIVVEVPEGINLNNVTVNTPNAHVTLKQGTYTTVISTTSGSTLVVEAGTTIETLTVIKGNVLIEAGATVNTITRHTDNTDPITEVFLPSDTSIWTNVGQNADSKIVPRYPTAQIANVFYYTLKDAIAAVPTDGTETVITLLRNHAIAAGVTIAVTQNIVLELNGKTLSGNTDQATTYALITNRGTLTIQDNTDTQKDGTGDGLITTYITNADQGDIPGYASNTITNNGNLTVKSGKIVNNGNGYACYAIDNQTNGNSYTPVVSIEGGRMQQMNAYTYAVRMFCNSTAKENTLVVSGGVIEGGYGLWLQTPNNKANKANLTISGGVINANDGAALYVGGTKADNSNISINISDGSINGTGIIIQGPLSGTYGEVSVSGGKHVNVQCGANVEKFISGGYFVSEPNEAFIAEGYFAHATGETDYPWEVVLGVSEANGGGEPAQGDPGLGD